MPKIIASFIRKIIKNMLVLYRVSDYKFRLRTNQQIDAYPKGESIAKFCKLYKVVNDLGVYSEERKKHR